MKFNISIEEAYALIEQNCKKIEETKCIKLIDALNYIVAEDLYSKIDNPPFSKSAMDGYALNLKKCKDKKLKIQDTVYAGDNYIKDIEMGSAVKIMTGAKIPNNCDTVIPKELCSEENGFVVINKEIEIGKNICFKAEEIRKGDLIIPKNTKLDYLVLSVLSGLGVKNVKVYRKPKIAILISGDEVCESSKELLAGKIYDTNGMLLSQRMKALNYPVEIVEFLPDNIEKVGEKIKRLSNDYDFIITTGGVSVGDKDIFHDVFEKIDGKKIFWRVKMKPGTPVLFSIVNDCPILSLSGNPFAAAVTFEIFARYLLLILTSDSIFKIDIKKAKLKDDFRKVTKTTRFIKGIHKDGMAIIPEGLHSSYGLKEMQECNVLIEIPKSEFISKNTEVNIWKI